MTLETMTPNPGWVKDGNEATVETFAIFAETITIRVWGGDWCKDCVNILPDFAAVLDAAGIPDTAIVQYPVEKLDDGSKVGPSVEEYRIEYIPTIIVERDNEELARFVENESVSAAEFIAAQLREQTPLQ